MCPNDGIVLNRPQFSRLTQLGNDMLPHELTLVTRESLQIEDKGKGNTPRLGEEVALEIHIRTVSESVVC